ncbi:lysophospholipid acyltransferase family protein [Kerstersia similis]|uniref:lysophospholipid acyltransferase family protein n=1 Tax=Kerstersia similis TaxID=206505 RepID=UPI0039F05674
MRFLRFTLRAMLLVPWLMSGLLTVALLYPVFMAGRGEGIVRGWSRILMRWCCGVRCEVVGQPLLKGPVLWTSNHVSWVDIFIINSVRASIFIAKKEVRQWPLIGWLAAGVGTLFIDRGYRQAVREVGQAVEIHFRRGRSVGLFPEGTTTDGMRLLPFRSGLFAPAVDAGVPVQPVALVFMQNGRRSSRAAFTGDQSLMANIWCILSTPRMFVRIEFLPVLQMPEDADHTVRRAQIARMAEQSVRQVVEV